MYLLVTALCPKCGNGFRAEAADPQDGSQHRCRCPRCYVDFPVGFDEAAASTQPCGWAIRAVPVAVAN